jgi:hypothetical protein
VADPVVLAITDLDDRPTGQLARLVAPCVVFSEDRHLRRPGLAPDDWRLVTTFAVDLVEAATRQHRAGSAAVNAFNLPLSVAIELVKFAGRRTGLPPWLIGGAAIVGGAVFLKEPERREAAGRYVMPVVRAIGREMSGAATQEQRGIRGLREVMLPPPASPSVRQRVAIVVARQREPMLAREVQERLLAHFPREPAPTVTEVRAVLKEGPEFVQAERYRW